MNSLMTLLGGIVDVRPERADLQVRVILSAVVIVIISSLCVAALGLKSLLIPILIVLAYFSLRFEMFLVHLLVSTAPLAMLFATRYYEKYLFSLAILIVFMWFGRILMIPCRRLLYSKYIVSFSFIFLSIAFLSFVNQGVSFSESVAFLKVCLFISLIWAVYDQLNPRKFLQLLISASVPIIIASSVLLARYIQHAGLTELIMLYRVKGGGFALNLNAFAFAVVVLLSLWTALGIWHPKANFRRICLIMALLFGVFLLLTAARASIIAFLFTALFYAYSSKKLRYFLFGIAAIAIIFLSVPSLAGLVELAFRVEANVTGRDVIWLNSLDMIRHHLWFGVGIGNYIPAYLQYLSANMWHTFIPPSAHNQILDMLAELGLIAVPVIIFLYYFPLQQGIRSLRKTSSEEERALILGGLGALFAVYARSIVEGGGMIIRGIPYPAVFFWMIFIVFLKINYPPVDSKPAPYSPL